MRQQFRPGSHGLNMFNFFPSNVRLSHRLCKFQPITDQRNATQEMAFVWTMDMTLKLINIVKNYLVVWQTYHKIIIWSVCHSTGYKIWSLCGDTESQEGLGGTRGEIVFIACMLARSRRRPIGLATITLICTFYYARNIVHYMGYCINIVHVYV